jgi:hypothetical protein
LRWVMGSFIVLPSMATVRVRCPRLCVVTMMSVLRVVWWRLVEGDCPPLPKAKKTAGWRAAAAHTPEEVPILLSQSDMSSRVLSWIQRDSARMRISLCMNVETHSSTQFDCGFD